MSEPSAADKLEQTRPLNLASLLALGINGTVGVGIFFAPREVLALVQGPQGALVYLLAALGLLPVAVVFGRLGRSFPQDGGPYVWARAAFGPTAGFCLGWLTYVSSALSAAAVLSGIGQQIAALVSAQDGRPIALGCGFLLAILAALGLRPSALALRIVTVLKLAPLLALVAVGLFALRSPAPASTMPSFLSLNAGRATLVVVFALQGFEIVPVLAGRSRSGHSVQRATLATLWACAALYALLHWVCALALAGESSPASPLVAAGRSYAGDAFAHLLEAGQLVSALGIAFGQVVTTPHYLAALGTHDGLGAWLGEVRASGAAVHALAVSVVLVGILVSAGELQSLFVLSSIAVLSQYCVAALSLMWLSLRARRGQGQGRSAPSGARAETGLAAQHGHVIWAACALLTSALLASYATAAELFTTALVVAVGVALLVVRRRLLRAA